MIYYITTIDLDLIIILLRVLQSDHGSPEGQEKGV